MSWPTTPIWTAAWLKASYLYGIDLTDDNGVEYPDALWEMGLEAARTWIEDELDIGLGGVQQHSFRAPFSRQMWKEFAMVRTPRKPARRLVSCKLKYGSREIFEVPEDWLQFNPASGVMHMTPGASGGTSYPLAIMGFVEFWMATLYDRLPGFMEVTYDYGFDIPAPAASRPADYLPAPANIIDVAAKYACGAALNPAGDLLVGAGIASISTSMDGISQNKNTTSSATNAGYGARIIQYRKDIDAALPLLRAKYHGIPVFMMS